MPKQSQSFPLLDILRDGPAWLGPVLAVKAFAIVGIVLPIVLQMALPAQQSFMRIALPGAVFLAIAIMAVWLFARAQRLGEKRTLNRVRNIEDVRALGWRRFEALLAEAFRREGYAVRRKDGGGPDGGVDVRLSRDGKATLVQCKHWKGKAGAPIVRELLGVVAAERAHAGIVVASGGFTKEAIGFADQATRQGQPLRLIDGDELLRMIKAVQPSQPEAERDVASQPPACPTCGAAMQRRLARRGANAGSEFWGCTRYPACKGTRDIA
ncbi:MAG: restriction endonuclease [Phycisphaerales bacterium]|jgi:restriction system protein